ncbi:twin-arginine translocase subunit TatC [Halorubrum halophilum]|uniref:twin-arginine translocase subunit TatC n=1 Tax=Halorubrum halophilum TaxID=413816 RepID=UPI00186B045D|nr:twin-arginine translocase subunit TatC [Halorubrum halophilum]
MDDSDRSRDEPSDPETDSADDHETVDGTSSHGDESVDTADESSDTSQPDADENGGDAESSSVEPEVTPEVTPEVGVDDEAGTAGDEKRGDAAEERAADETGDDSADAAEEGDADDSVDADDTDEDPADGTAADPDAPTVEDGGVASAGTADVDDEYDGIEAPETDEEMPLAAHIEEMMRRLAVVFVFGGLATLVVVTESTELINYFWSYHIPAPLENRPRLYGPLELPLTRLKVAGLAGVVVGLPAFVYQTYRFMKPGLYENERRYYLAAVPTSLILGGIGIAFAHFLVLPAIFSYFTTYTSDAATIAFGLAETFNLIVIMLAFMAIVFQIPLFIMLAIMMNLVTRQWLEAKRLIFWGAFLGIAFLFSPDPTGMAPIIVTLTMIVLYEGTLAVLRWTGN